MWEEISGLSWVLDAQDKQVRLYRLALTAVALVFFVSMGALIFVPGDQ
jgi:hypothetical protein